MTTINAGLNGLRRLMLAPNANLHNRMEVGEHGRENDDWLYVKEVCPPMCPTKSAEVSTLEYVLA